MSKPLPLWCNRCPITSALTWPVLSGDLNNRSHITYPNALDTFIRRRVIPQAKRNCQTFIHKVLHFKMKCVQKPDLRNYAETMLQTTFKSKASKPEITDALVHMASQYNMSDEIKKGVFAIALID
eukprot:534120_1